MAKMRTYVCPGANGYGEHEFSFLHHPSSEPAPRFCPKCGYDSESEDFGKAITAPHVQDSTTVKAVEYEYRSMEEGSQQRIDAAADMTGLDAIDFGDMKITDLKDNLREGDIAAVNPAPNPVSQAVAAAPNIWGFQGAAIPQGGMANMPTPTQYAANAHGGPLPFRGLQTGQKVRGFHGGWQGSNIAPPPVTDNPSLEVLNRDAMLRSPAARRGRR